MASFATGLEVEAAILYDMLWEGVLPAISKQLILERGSLSALDGLEGMEFPEGDVWRDYIGGLGRAKAALIADAKRLHELKDGLGTMTLRDRAECLAGTIVPLMEQIRARCDAAELVIASDIWPYPIYRNLLSLSA